MHRGRSRSIASEDTRTRTQAAPGTRRQADRYRQWVRAGHAGTPQALAHGAPRPHRPSSAPRSTARGPAVCGSCRRTRRWAVHNCCKRVGCFSRGGRGRRGPPHHAWARVPPRRFLGRRRAVWNGATPRLTELPTRCCQKRALENRPCASQGIHRAVGEGNAGRNNPGTSHARAAAAHYFFLHTG